MRPCGLFPVSVEVVIGPTEGKRVRIRRLACAVTLGLSTLTAPALAQRPSLRFLDAGGAVVTGQRVTVAWEGVSADVDELEILLSVDGGERFPIRLTHSLSPASGPVTWTVPSLATRCARLRLRYGRGGREDEGERSDPFAILVPPTAPLSRLERREGECWIAVGAGPLLSGILPVDGARPAIEVEAVAADVPDEDWPYHAPRTTLPTESACSVPAPQLTSLRPAFTLEPEAPKRE